MERRRRFDFAAVLGSVFSIASFTFFVIIRTNAASRRIAAGVWAVIWEAAVLVATWVMFALLAVG